MKRYAMFWGCTIPARFPYIEKSVRLASEKFGLRFEEIDGFTCCPERSLVKSMDEDIWRLSAARNIAVAEKSDLNIVTPCTGCHSVLRTVRSELISDVNLKNKVNEKLKEIGLSFTGKSEVFHLTEVLYEELGPALMSKKVIKPLWGMRIAVHFGCHLVRPSNAVRWDDNFNPSKINELVTALGAKIVGYPSSNICCGSYLGRVGNQEGSLSFSRHKLEDIKENKADALVVVCPSCYQQFDLNQSILIRKKADLNIPVFYLTELMALAADVTPDELGLSMHRVKTDSFTEKLEKMESLRSELLENFSLPEIEKCYACRACKNDCPSAKIDSSFDPTEVIGKVLAGQVDELLQGAEIWKCVECDLCHELCPQRYAMDETFRILKHLSIKAGYSPKQVNSGVDAFMSTGLLGSPREADRENLGLPKLPRHDVEQWKKLLKESGDING